MAEKKIKKPLTESQKKLLEKIGGRIREIRNQKGHKSYMTFAFENDFSHSWLGEIERGQSDFRVGKLIQILEELDVSLEEFFKGFTEPKKKGKKS